MRAHLRSMIAKEVVRRVRGTKARQHTAENNALELAIEISFTSLGSSQTLRRPQFRTDAANRFCSFNDTIVPLLRYPGTPNTERKNAVQILGFDSTSTGACGSVSVLHLSGGPAATYEQSAATWRRIRTTERELHASCSRLQENFYVALFFSVFPAQVLWPP
jgi:hypothetical protein